MNRVRIRSSSRDSTDHMSETNTVEDDDEDGSLEDEEEARAKKPAPVKILTEADIARMEWEEKNVDLIKPIMKKWQRIKERTVTRLRKTPSSVGSLTKAVASTESELFEGGLEEISEEQEEEWDEDKEMETAEDVQLMEPEFDFDDFDDMEDKEPEPPAPEEKSPEELLSPTSSSFSDTDKEEEFDSTSDVEEESMEKEELDDGTLLAPFIAELFMSEEALLTARQKRVRGSTTVLNLGRDDVMYRRESYVSARNLSTSTDTNFEIVLSSSDEGKVPLRKSRMYHKLRLVGEQIIVAREYRKALKNHPENEEDKFEQKEFNEIDFSQLKGMESFVNDEFVKKKQIYDKFRLHNVKKTVETLMEEIEGGTPEELAKKKEFEKSVIVKPGLRKKMWQRMVQPHLDRYTDFIDAMEWSIENDTMPESFHESALGLEELTHKEVTPSCRTEPKSSSKKKTATCFLGVCELSEKEPSGSTASSKAMSRKDSVKQHLEDLRKKDMKFKKSVSRSFQAPRSVSELQADSSKGKPYHEVCRNRIKQNVKEYRAMFRNELELLAKGQTFALRGIQIQRQFEVGVAKCNEVLRPWTYKERKRIEQLLSS